MHINSFLHNNSILTVNTFKGKIGLPYVLLPLAIYRFLLYQFTQYYLHQIYFEANTISSCSCCSHYGPISGTCEVSTVTMFRTSPPSGITNSIVSPSIIEVLESLFTAII